MSRLPHQVIFINGPRRSGKDTAAGFIVHEWLNVRHKKFAGVMKQTLRALFSLSDEQWKQFEQSPSGQSKLLKMPQLQNMSWVEALIWFSEDVMKPRFGADIFGKLLVEDMRNPTSTALTVISDCGFVEEVIPVCKAYGANNCHMFQLFRPDFSFAEDSRSYLAKEDLPPEMNWHVIQNMHDKDMYRRQILIRTNKILGTDRIFD